MAAALDLTEPLIFAALRAWALSVLPAGVEVVQGQINRVPTPPGANFAVFWPTSRKRLATNTVTASAEGPGPELNANHYMQPTQLSVQFETHGPDAADNMQMLSTLARSEYTTGFFEARAEPVQMLYMDDPRQMAFETGERQLEDRWIVDAVLQANPTVTTVQQFADALVIGLIEVDATYPPGDA